MLWPRGRENELKYNTMACRSISCLPDKWTTDISEL